MKTIYALVNTSQYSSASLSWSTSGSTIWQAQTINVSDDILYFFKMQKRQNANETDLDLTGYSSLRFLIRRDKNITSSLYAFQDSFNQQSDADEDLSLGQVSFLANTGNIEYDIVGVDTGTDTISIDGDWTNQFASGEEIEIQNSTANDGTYTIDTVSLDSSNNETDISLTTSITDATVDGEIVHNKAKIDLAASNSNSLDCWLEVNGIDANGNHSTLTQLQIEINDQLDDGTAGSANSKAPTFQTTSELQSNFADINTSITATSPLEIDSTAGGTEDLSANRTLSISFGDGLANNSNTLEVADLDSTNLKTNSSDDSDGAIQSIFEIAISGGAAADYDLSLTSTVEVIDFVVIHTSAGQANDTIQLKDTSDNVISDAMDFSGADKSVVRASEIDDANSTTSSLRVTTTDDDSGGDGASAKAYIYAIKR